MIKCLKCNKDFEPSQWNQIYCGSKTLKTGCSYKEHINKVRIFNNTKGKEKQLKRIREWMKKQRLLNTPYAQRQREQKRKISNSERGKEIQRLWRKKNIAKILFWNRKRVLKKRNVIGSHTQEEWNYLKKLNRFCCAICGISEQELQIKWKGKGFTKLTRDHIRPLSKGGTDYISNIRPLCISCNAKKRDSFILGCTSMYANPVHIGHIRLMQEAKKLCDYLVVIVNNDKQVKLKGSKPFMDEDERCDIIKSIKYVDEVVLSIDHDRTVCRTLAMIKPDIFAKGGDSTDDNVPEKNICKVVLGVGGGKIQSSSWLKENL